MRKRPDPFPELRGMIANAPQIDEARFRRLLMRAANNLQDPAAARFMIEEVHEALLTAKLFPAPTDAGHDHWQDVVDSLNELETAARAAV